jgi:hypothetical protein
VVEDARLPYSIPGQRSSECVELHSRVCLFSVRGGDLVPADESDLPASDAPLRWVEEAHVRGKGRGDERQHRFGESTQTGDQPVGGPAVRSSLERRHAHDFRTGGAELAPLRQRARMSPDQQALHEGDGPPGVLSRKDNVGRSGRAAAFVLSGLTLAAVAVSEAQAHGPCRSSATKVGCLSPSVGGPGACVTICGTPVYKVVWNQNVAYDSESHYKRGARTVELLRLPRVRRNVQFVVPRAKPGVYPVAIYDGAEGGEHYTWNLFRVRKSSSAWLVAWPWLVIAAIVLLAAVASFVRGPTCRRRAGAKP